MINNQFIKIQLLNKIASMKPTNVKKKKRYNLKCLESKLFKYQEKKEFPENLTFTAYSKFDAFIIIYDFLLNNAEIDLIDLSNLTEAEELLSHYGFNYETNNPSKFFLIEN